MTKRNKSVVIGDLIFQYNLQTRLHSLGGAGNVIEHLNLFSNNCLLSLSPDEFRQADVSFKSSFQESPFGTRVDSIYIDSYKTKGCSIRIWNDNKVVYRTNSKIESSKNLESYFYLIENNITSIYLEWHLVRGVVLPFLLFLEKNQENEEVAKWISNLTIYLDTRNPSSYLVHHLQRFDFKKMYWKLNGQEKAILDIYEKEYSFMKNTSQIVFLFSKGSEGLVVESPDDPSDNIQIDASDHQCVQSCGCGDSFFATFFAANEYLEGLTFRDKCQLAVIAGGVSVSKPGVVVTTPRDLIKYIEDNPTIDPYNRLRSSLSNY